MISALAFAFYAAASSSPSPRVEWQRYFDTVTRAGEAVDADEFAEVDFGKPPISIPVQIPFGDGNTTAFRPDTDAFYVYENGKLRLNFSPSSDTLYGRSNGFVIGSWITPNGSYLGRNSFGVSTRVSKAFVRTVGVETGRLPLGEVSAYRSAYSDERYGNNYWIELTVGGSEARTLTSQAYVELALRPNQKTFDRPECKTLLDTATLDRPVEAVRTVCAFPADVESIAIKRRDTGAVLAQWPRIGDGAALMPIGSETEWIGERDYPYASGRKGESGEVAVEMVIAPDGSAVNCRVIQGTGFESLDRQTCRVLIERAKFEPFKTTGASEKIYRRTVIWPSGRSPSVAGEKIEKTPFNRRVVPEGRQP